MITSVIFTLIHYVLFKILAPSQKKLKVTGETPIRWLIRHFRKIQIEFTSQRFPKSV